MPESQILVLNTAGLTYPRPVTDTERAVAKTTAGEVLTIWATDPRFESEIRAALGGEHRIETTKKPLPERMQTERAKAGTQAVCAEITVKANHSPSYRG